jgi:hypothetical protein
MLPALYGNLLSCNELLNHHIGCHHGRPKRQRCFNQTLPPVHDIHQCLSLVRNMEPTDVIILPTPSIAPPCRGVGNALHTFECLGQALACKMYHESYMNTGGFIGTHAYHKKSGGCNICCERDKLRTLSLSRFYC